MYLGPITPIGQTVTCERAATSIGTLIKLPSGKYIGVHSNDLERLRELAHLVNPGLVFYASKCDPIVIAHAGLSSTVDTAGQSAPLRADQPWPLLSWWEKDGQYRYAPGYAQEHIDVSHLLDTPED